MAIRNIVLEGDEILRKTSRPVEKFDGRLHTLLDDMKETMDTADGIGLAAPQVGVLRRIFIMDLDDEQGTVEFINPQIVLEEGSQIFCEGCLSIPETKGNVERPERVVIKAQDRNGKEFEFDAKDLAAVCVSHENDHLNGILFTDKVIDD